VEKDRAKRGGENEKTGGIRREGGDRVCYVQVDRDEKRFGYVR